MADRSMDALTSLLVSVTSYGRGQQREHDPQAEQGTQRQDNKQTHAQLRRAAHANAKRKARVLSKHRPVLVRWTSAATSIDSTLPRRPCGETVKCASSDDNGSGNSNGDQPTIVQSDLLSLEYTDSLGRHLVAGVATIPAGTVLFRESPFAWCLRPEFAGDFCAHCLREVVGSATSCLKCGRVAFCSVACATVAGNEWHESECLDASENPLEPAMSGMSPECRVALRAFRRAKREGTLKGSSEAVNPTSSIATAAEVATSAPSAGTRFCISSTNSGDDRMSTKFSDLQEHYTTRSARERDVLETKAAIATVLASGGCADVDTDDRSGERGSNTSAQEVCEALAAELVTALFKVSTNAFTISTLSCFEAAVGHVRPLTHARVGVGLYVAAAMLNHSCVPNAVVTFHGGEMTVVAARAIEKGAPVTISYGPLASKVSSTSERRRLLQTAYFFRCECAACLPEQSAFHPDDELRSSRDGGAARCRTTEFACMESGCRGTLLVGVSPLPSTLCRREGAEDGAAARFSSRHELWCNRCGTHVPSRAVDALLKEDEEDRRLWDEAMLAVTYSEGEMIRNKGESPGQQSSNTANGSGSSTRGSSPKSTGASLTPLIGSPAATAAALVLERARWRDRRLSPLAMRRAVAHDMHARLLAEEQKFSVAADACARAIQVLEQVFAPEDQELGVEYLKLAELCFNAGLTARCVAACTNARVSLEVCLRPGDEQLVALNNMQALCVAHRPDR